MGRGVIVDGVLVIWFIVTALSVIYVAWDAFLHTPELRVMRWGWVLVTLYTGPVGAAVYVLACQEPGPGAHEKFVAPLWKQGVGSAIHCLAGDATGVIVAAVATASLRFSMGADAVVEYGFGFAFGLLVFQALFMKDMLGGSYVAAVRRSLLPEWLSMNAVMAGMIPTMLILMSANGSAMDPTSPRFWGVMSLATLVGVVTAYPVNVWLVAVGLKHGMGTERALGRGGVPRTSSMATATSPMRDNTDGVGAEQPSGTGPDVAMRMPGHTKPTPSQLVAVALLTMLLLGGGILIGALYGQPGMRRQLRGDRAGDVAPTDLCFPAAGGSPQRQAVIPCNMP